MNRLKEPLKEWRKSASELRAGWRPLVFFDLLFKLLSLAILAPLSALFLGAILKWSGDRAISNFDLISFFLSPLGILLVVVTATLGFVVVFFELGGLAMIVLGIREGKQPSAIRTLQFLGKHFRQLCVLGLRQFLALGGIAAAVLGIVLIAKSTLLSGGEIYFYLQTKPPEYRIALTIAGFAALAGGIAGAILVIRWLFSVPLLLTGNQAPNQAMKESPMLVRSTGIGVIIKKAAIWALGSLVIVTISGGFQWALQEILALIAGERIGWVIASAALLQTVGLILGTIVSFLMAVAFVATISRLFVEASPASKVPGSICSGNTQIEHRHQLQLRWWIFGSGTGMAALSAIFAWLLIDRIQIDSDVAVTAHRGSSLAAPENTMAAIVQAIEDGSDYVEIDVMETADGIVVLIHDTDLRRLASVDRNTWEVPFAEMKEYDFGSWFSDEFTGERIVSLEEAIEAVRGKSKLNIELKHSGHDQQLEAAVERLVRESGFESDCIVMSLNYEGVRKIAGLNDNLKTGLTLTAGVGNPTNFKVDFLAVNANSVTRDLVTRAHQSGMEIHVWTVNEPTRMLTMIHLGVDNIITDAPDVLVNLLRERESLTNAEKTLLYLADFLAGRI